MINEREGLWGFQEVNERALANRKKRRGRKKKRGRRRRKKVKFSKHEEGTEKNKAKRCENKVQKQIEKKENIGMVTYYFLKSKQLHKHQN